MNIESSCNLTLDDIEDNHVDESDEGWESDTSGPTDAPSQDELHDPTPLDTKENNAQQNDKVNSAETQDDVYPLSSTVVGNTDSVFDYQVDPNLSPVAHLNTESILNNLTSKEKLSSISSMTAIATTDSTKTCDMNKLCTSVETVKRNSDAQQTDCRSKTTENSSVKECILNDINPSALVKQNTPLVPSSLAEAILSTRNRIANVLFEAVVNSQGETSSKSSGYESLSSDCTSSTIQRTSTFFLADKLLKEFNSRLTAEIMSGGDESFSSPRKALPMVKPKKSRMLIRPSLATRGKRKTVSLLAARRTIKVNPSIQLPTNDNIIKIGLPGSEQRFSSECTSTTDSRTLTTCSPTNRGSVKCLPGQIGGIGLPVKATHGQEIIPSTTKVQDGIGSSNGVPVRVNNSSEIVPRGGIEPSGSRIPTKIVSTKAVLRLSPGLPAMKKLEVSVSDIYGTKTQSFESALFAEKRSSPFPLFKQPLPTLTVKFPKLPLPNNHRRSIPLPLPCLPGQKSEQDRCILGRPQDINTMCGTKSSRDIVSRATNNFTRNKSSEVDSARMLSPKTTNKFPRKEYGQEMPTIDSNRFPKKRSLEDVGVKLTSPKRACHRPGNSNQQDICRLAAPKTSHDETVDSDISPSLKRNNQENAQGLPLKRRRECSDCFKRMDEINGKGTSPKCTSTKTRRSSVKLPHDTKSRRIQLNSSSSDLENNTCRCECSHMRSYDSGTSENDLELGSSSETFLDERLDSSKHPNGYIYDETELTCDYDESHKNIKGAEPDDYNIKLRHKNVKREETDNYDEKLTQKNIREQRSVSKPSRRTSMDEFERLYYATQQQTKQARPSARSNVIHQHVNFQRPLTPTEGKSRGKSTDDIHRASENSDISPEESRRMYSHNYCKQYETSSAKTSTTNRHPLSEKSETSPENLRKRHSHNSPGQHQTLRLKTHKQHTQHSPKQSRESPVKTRRLYVSGSPEQDSKLPVGSGQSNSPHLRLLRSESPRNASPTHHNKCGKFSTKLPRPNSSNSSKPYRVTNVKTHGRHSSNTVGHYRTPDVQILRRQNSQSPEQEQKSSLNSHRSHSSTSTLKSQKQHSRESSNSQRKTLFYNHKRERPVDVKTHRNTPTDHLRNRQQRGRPVQQGNEKYCELQTNHRIIKSSPPGSEKKHFHEFFESDADFKTHKSGRDNFLKLKSRNPHKILESTRKEFLEPIRQTGHHKHLSSSKDKRGDQSRLSKKQFTTACHTEENSLPCVTGRCKKGICFDCGSFSLEETNNLSL